uniref:Uncharacterized protein n=1 Tax=Anopheles quadriannulatus TaxID=34691 RepID=A0A182WTV7_ANOQN
MAPGGYGTIGSNRKRLLDAEERQTKLRPESAIAPTSNSPAPDGPVAMAEAAESVPQKSVQSTDSLEESDVDVGSDDEWSIFDSSDPYSETDDDTEDSTDNEDYGSNTFVQNLRAWAIATGQTRFALNSLLALLREKTNLKVPKNARTLLKVPSKPST